jgi:uncharacterized protein YndB with AHSA1/START domain
MTALSINRFIAAPPEKVWQIMTERQAEWWCPLPWRAEIIEQDWRAGGRSSMVMRGPEGVEHPDDGIFLEVVPGQRWVATDAVTRCPDGTLLPSGPFMIGCWEIAPEGDGTRYTATARHWTEEAAGQHASMGFHEGWGAAADQLKVLCEAS